MLEKNKYQVHLAIGSTIFTLCNIIPPPKNTLCSHMFPLNTRELTPPSIFSTHLNILINVKVKILLLIEWSYRFPQSNHVVC